MGIFYSKDPGRSGRRTIATFLLFLFTFGLASASFLGAPRKANAQYTDPITSVQTTTTNVWTTIKDAFVEAAVTAVVNGVNYFTSQLAYTAAVALTSDCPGQVVCWNSKAFEDGFKQAWQGAIGEAIGTLSTQGGFTKLGFDLCNPGINFSLKIQLGALDEIKPPPPKCDFNAVTSNWSNFKDSVTSGEVLKGLKPTFSKGEAPLSVALGAQSGLYEVKEEAKRADVMKRIMDASAGGGFSDVRDPVSGRAKAPSSVTHDEFQRMKKMQQDNPQQYSASYAAGQIASKAVISIVVNAVQTFAMTLISRLLNKLINGLMSTEELIALQPDLILNPEGLLQPPGATGATEAFSTRFSAAQPKDTGIIDPLLEFSVCPGSERGPNNCVIDQQFANAIRVADVTPVTVREAIEKNMLHGDWLFVSSSDPVKDQDPFCYTYAYCESNLKKLRAARILPIGWEIAARKAGSNTKLREVVDNFNNCNDAGTMDAGHPWCHLIDPDWVLKIPPTQCRAMAFGAVPLSSEIPSRSEQCVDPQTCLKQDDNGTCVGGYGYCARERNVWRFNGDSCPAAYNTCRTLRSRTGEVKNFILNTIDHGVCNSDNAGCRQYGQRLSTVTCELSSPCTHPTDPSDPIKSCTCNVLQGDTDGNGETCRINRNQTSCTAPDGTVCRQAYPCTSSTCACDTNLTCEVEKGQRSCSSLTGAKTEGDDWRLEPSLFFNKTAQSCDAGSNGCSALVRLEPGDSLNLVRNPSFEEVEDGDNDGTPDHPTFWTPFGDVPSSNRGSLSRDGSMAFDGSNAISLPNYGADFDFPSVIGTSATCTIKPGTCSNSTRDCTVNGDCTGGGTCNPNPNVSGGLCVADLGCPCTYLTAGNVVSNSCKVIKNQAKCTVTQDVSQQGIPVRRRSVYTMSATFIPSSGDAVTGAIGLSFRDANGAVVNVQPLNVVTTTNLVDGTGTVNCAATDDGTPTGAASGEINMLFSGTKDATVKGARASCTFVIDNIEVSHATLWLYNRGGGLVYADGVQLEQGGGTAYHSGYGAANVDVPQAIKVPPAFLGCTGAEEDRPECAGFAGVCLENEVGCDAYTPTNGDPMVPGIAGPQDRCPAECAGYDVFKQEESNFDTVKFPVFFIPDTATICSENEVGCSEFTNLETEKVEYYSRLRLCIKPDDTTKGVYYSWEGSETTGYQLLVWNFKNTTTAANVSAGVLHDTAGSGLASDVCADPTDAVTCPVAGGGRNAGPAPCTKLDASATACASQAIGNPSTDKVGYCSRAAIDGGDFDCREFYDANGNRHYRLLSKTIISSSTCEQYRITTSTQVDCEKSNGRWDAVKGACIYFADAGASNACIKEQNGCRAYKGNAATNVQSLFHDDFENWPDAWSDADDNQSNGLTPLTQSGESITVGGHSLKIGTTGSRVARREIGGLVRPSAAYTLTFWARGTGSLNVGFRDGTTSTVCTNASACPVDEVGGCICSTFTGLSCVVPNDGVSTTCTIARAQGTPGVSNGTCKGGTNNTNVCANAAACPGGTCSFSTPTAAAPRSSNFADDDESSSPPRTTAPKITLTSEWKQYSLGPVIIEPGRCSNDANRACATNLDCSGGAACNPTPGQTPWGQTSVKLSFEAIGSSDVFIDNVDLRAVQDSVFVVRDSWNTPASCDMTATGIPSPQEMLGCKEYTTSANEKAYLRSFTSLCRERAIGCRAYSTMQLTTQNPYEESFNAVCRLYEIDGITGLPTTTPRKCGFISCTQSTCTNPGGCTCTRPQGSCLIPNNGTACDISVPVDAGAACSCDYNTRNPAARSDAPQYLSDVCRVAIGDTDCRFKLDAWDDSTRPDEHPDRVNIEADSRVFLTNAAAGQCSAAQIGCTAMGRPHYGFEGQCDLGPGTITTGTQTNGVCTTSTGCVCTLNGNSSCSVAQGEKGCKASFELGVIDKWDALAIKNDPTKYETSLCTAKTLNCEEYTATDGTYYFRDPVDKVCEYKDNANINGAQVSGFFRRSSTGALFPCYPELLQQGDYYALYKNADRICTLPLSGTGIVNGRCNVNGGCLCYVAPDPIAACKVYKGNTTCGYQGWVGVCEAKYDRCEEFIDPVSTSASHPAGQPYYYIVNNKLDLKTCAGKASLKQGCVLFKQTSKTSAQYSAAASYLRSKIEAANGIVPPVNCDTDPRSTFCEQRCFSIPEGICSETTDKFCKQDTEDPDLGCPGPTNVCTGRKRYGNGCFMSNGAKDCNQSIGELCAGVAHCSVTTRTFCDDDSDCPGTETCVEPPEPPASTNLDPIHIPASESVVTRNDSNLIIKVRPDRECAQWYTCTSYEQVYDEQQNKNKPKCSAFSLCDEIKGQTANNFECAHTFEPPKKVLVDKDYAARDVTFAGLEYSGYSIPGRYPAQYLSPFSIVKGFCATAAGTPAPGAPTTCTDSLVCTDGALADTNYCKMYHGICQGDRINTSCDDNSQCGTGYCSRSFFATTRYGILLDASYVCKVDSDCDGNDAGGHTGTICTSDDQCRTATNRAARCIDVDNDGVSRCDSKTGQEEDGACLEHKCFYSYGGGTLNGADAVNAALCRAYPEEDSPYAESVVERNAGGIRGFDNVTGQAINKKAQFGGSNVCGLNNDCECSYQRFEYGKGGNSIRFWGMEGAKALVPTSPSAATWQDLRTDLGVCSGGTNDGRLCRLTGLSNKNADCITSIEDAGTCQPLTKISHLNGWPGFCMDPDKSIMINGRQDQFNCNVWLPVDQLAGSPDNFNQFIEAGFTTDQTSLLYCAASAGNPAGGYVVQLHDESGGKSQPISICVTDGTCAARGVANCLTGSNNNSHVSGAGGDLQASNTAPCAIVGGACVDRVGTDDGVVHTNNNPGTGASTTGDDGWRDSFQNGVQNPGAYGACDRAAFRAGDKECTTAVIMGAIFGGYAGAAGAYMLCGAAIASWCDGLVTCRSQWPPSSAGGPFFDTSWQDATARTHDMRGHNLYENQLMAISIEFPNEQGDGVQGRMYLYPGHWKATFLFDDNSSLGTAAGPGSPGGQPVGGKAIGEYPGNNPCTDMNLSESNCENIEDHGLNNCIGAEAIFDGSGKLDHLRTVLCHNESTFSHSVAADAFAMVKEVCTDIVQTHNASNQVQNIAWTDRMWQAQNSNPGAVGLAGKEYDHHTDRPRALSGGSLKPFGPISPALGAFNFNSVTTLDVRWPYPVFTSEGGSPYINFRREGDNRWYHCGPTSDAQGMNNTDCGDGWTHVASDPHLPPAPEIPAPGVYNDSTQPTVAGYAYQNCDGPCTGAQIQAGYNEISKMFVKSFNHFFYDHSPGTLRAPPVYTRTNAGYDNRIPNLNATNQPKLRASMADCSQQSDGLCREGAEDTITIDAPIPPGTSHLGRVSVKLKYYAYADKEHMPIRRRIVDFGDGTPVLQTPGFYKNHRGCGSTDNPPAGCDPGDKICGTGGPPVPFGFTPQSCEDRYFLESHTYTCNPQKLATLPQCGSEGKPYPCRDGDDCVFKPRIQILDNWGMCNGSCPGGSGEPGNVCFNGRGLSDENDPINLLGTGVPDPVSTGTRNECWNLQDRRYEIRDSAFQLQRPWTEGAEIRVRQ